MVNTEKQFIFATFYFILLWVSCWQIPFFFFWFEVSELVKLEDFPGGSDSKESAYNEGDPGSIPGLGRYPGEGNGNPLQYSCLENTMDGGTW